MSFDTTADGTADLSRGSYTTSRTSFSGGPAADDVGVLQEQIVKRTEAIEQARAWTIAHSRVLKCKLTTHRSLLPRLRKR